jgi:uncharacterized protein YjiK
MLISESKAELILYDPAAQREVKRWGLDAAAILGSAPEDRNQGFEGLAFRAEPGRPGGGTYYLAHQRTPATVVALAFDPATAPSRLGAESVVARWPQSNFEDLTAVTYVPSLDRVLVIADGVDKVLVLGPDGSVEAELPLPGQQQEGLAFDGTGTMWVADDQDKSLLRIPGGLAALEAQLKAGASPSGPTAPTLLKNPNLLGN